MNVIPLGSAQLALSAVLVLALAALSLPLRLRLWRGLLIAAIRTAVQLMLVGLVLRFLFADQDPLPILLMALVMLSVAGWEVMRRQGHRYRGIWGFGIGAASLGLSTFTVTLFGLTLVIQVEPWYQPQYLIPLLGMLLGNAMTGVAIALNDLTRNVSEHRDRIEARLLAGADWREAIGTLRREALRAGLIPLINAMSAAGLVSLPGMMTGQILSGSPPAQAARYQIMIMYLITASTGFGSVLAVWLGSRRLFDERQRLRLDRLY